MREPTEYGMSVITYLVVNQQVEHVVTLPANLQTSFDPIQTRCLEELGRLQLMEEVLHYSLL